MLVLSRKKDEKLIIRVGAVEILVCVVEVRGDKVRLGVEAPREVTINREEIQEVIDAAYRNKTA